MESIENREVKTLEITEKVPNELVAEQLEIYEKYSNIEGYAMIIFVAFPVLVLIHNFLIAGRSYEYEVYETIKTIELSIVGVLIAVTLIIAMIAIRLQRQLNKSLEATAKKYAIKIEVMEKEFNILSVYLYGGRGVTLKKSRK
ncbi:hypothetical protein [Tenacibaculum maritimum]|uniref:Uncharacterized protein n=1 Tax=Tenacibaculum maritimum NCIMB 2154 TaxID=1349785 RepID=A0A2H1E868_9FLAO|nr:hypothetical protein [Tenacibaculum maritimum]SFZ80608.1 conserved protein of unknown function [Tenacibaculum maritimum NCIMB 2154]